MKVAEPPCGLVPPVADVAAPSASAGRPLKLLLLEDSEDDEALVIRAIRREGYAPTWTRIEDADAMREALAGEAWDLIVSDWSMPRFSAPEALAVLKESELDLPFIIVSGTIGEESAVSAMRDGAGDFLLKGKLSRLGPTIDRELREHDVRRARRSAEAQLRASEARYRLLFDSSPLPMWLYDLATLRFLAVNEAAIRHYGYSADEFAAMTLVDIRSTEDGPSLRADASARPPADDTKTWRHRKKDGSVILVEIKAHDFEFEGKSARLVLANDVTARVRAQEALAKSEDQLRQSQKMEAVGRLAGGVAHDFNNILSVILSYASLSLDALPEGSSIREDLEEIEKAGMRAADLTRQLLGFSRQQVFEARILDVNEVLAGIDKMLHRILGEDIELATLATPSLSKIRADKGQIEQVVMNLVVNARDAIATNGHITIETANVLLDDDYAKLHLGAKAGPHVMIAVSDTGSGMDKATQSRIFEPFFTTKEVGKGTGLGLATVFGIVQSYGGTIWVYSEVGKGTTFKIYFPAWHDEAVRVVPKADDRKRRARRGSETVLLVEDEEQVRVVARGILRRQGYVVLEASTPDEAVRISEELDAPVHLLLTDVVLPRLSGTELAERLRRARPGMRILFMSGYAGEAVVRHGILESQFPFLQKPLTPATLSKKVREVLDA